MGRRTHALRRAALSAIATLLTLTAVTAADRPAVTVETVAVVVPDTPLTATDGAAATARAVLDVDRPVMLNFLFTTCATVCPILGAGFADAQSRFAEQGRDVLLVSISIDPEHDTPAVLRSYAEALDAGASWRFFTGRPEDIDALQRAFGAYRGSKFTHRPLTFIRPAAGADWLRLEGYPDADALIEALDQARALETAGRP